MISGGDECSLNVTTPRRRGLVWIVRYGLYGLLLVAGVALFAAVRRAREAAIASAAQSPLNQLHLALENYHHVYGCFPPAYVAGPDGERMHSWRVLILPYIDGVKLYEQYDFSQPWNSEKNRQLADRMPLIFNCPSEKPSSTYTNFVAIVGTGTAFPGSTSTSIADIEDGLDNTVLLGEISNSTIEWLEPRDLDFDTMSFSTNDPTKPSLSTSRRNGPYVVFADWIHAYAVTPAVHPEVLKGLITIKGHEGMFLLNVQGPEFSGLVSPKVGAAADIDLSQFGNWQNARALWLNRSPISDAGLQTLRSARSLGKIDLSATSITDEGLKCLEHHDLYSLNLSNTRITDIGLKHLNGLSGIKYLFLANTETTSVGRSALRQRFPGCQVTPDP